MAQSDVTIQPAPTPWAAGPAHAMYLRLVAGGLTAREAGALVGRANGLPPVAGGWAIGEVEHLLFVTELVRSGRIGS